MQIDSLEETSLNKEFPVEALKAWFRKERRPLPWRFNPTPYSVWVSEIMLQQTQASVVIPYFLKWLELFPTLEQLAQAPLEQVIKAWEGLGYYSRVRNMHEAAGTILQKYQGRVPSDPQILSQIKGIGPYTVGAILSFAYHQRIPAIDANVQRVLARYFLIEEQIDRVSAQKSLYSHALNLLPKEEPWVVNEALIELGATLCTKKPLCPLCPLKSGCGAYKEGKMEQLPRKRPPSQTTLLRRTVALITCEGEVLVRRGEAGKIFADLYYFPWIEECLEPEEATLLFQKELGLSLTYLSKLPELSHSFTRYRALLSPLLFEAKAKDLSSLWIKKEELKHYPFASGHRSLVREVT